MVWAVALGGASHGHEEPPRRRHNAPLSIAAALHEGHAHVQTLEVFWARLVPQFNYKLNATKLKLMSDTPNSDQIEVEARTSRQHLPVLIFDELEYEPFTENRRWPSGKLKIARPGAPATPLQLQTMHGSMPSSRSGLRAGFERLS
jgi:hypothetical protein